MSAASARTTGAPMATLALLGAAALLVGATLAWPAITVTPREARSLAAASALLERVAAAERAWARTHGAYAAIEPDGTLRGAAPGAPALPAGDLQVDAQAQPGGGLRLRVLSRPEAVGAGRLFPVLLDTLLPPADARGAR